MLRLLAKISLRTVPEGGHTVAGYSGMQPSFSVGDDLIICSILTTDGQNEIAPGRECRVVVELPYGERYDHEIHAGKQFRLQVGSRVIGEGSVIRRIPEPEDQSSR